MRKLLEGLLAVAVGGAFALAPFWVLWETYQHARSVYHAGWEPPEGFVEWAAVLSDSSSCGGCVVLLGSLDAFRGCLVGGGRMEQAGGAENVKRLLLVGALLVGQGAEAQEAVPGGLVRIYADSTAARLELIANLIDASGDPNADPVSRAIRSRRDGERISQALDEAIEYSYAAVFAAGAVCGGSGILRYATLYLGIGSAIVAVRSWPFYPDDRSGFAEILRRQAEDNRRGGRAVERDCAGRGGNKEHRRPSSSFESILSTPSGR